MSRITLRLDDGLVDLLKYKAKEEGVTLSTITRRLIEAGLGVEQDPSKSNTGAASSGPNNSNVRLIQNTTENKFLLRYLITHICENSTNNAKDIISLCTDKANEIVEKSID